MASLVTGYFPNRRIVQYAASAATWVILATDGTGYANLAALQAAGKTPWPAMDPGVFVGQLRLRTVNNGADGGPFFYAINPAATPTDATETFVSGAGQTVIESPGNVYTLWVRCTVVGDTLIAEACF